MKSLATFLLATLFCQPAVAGSDAHVFRTVAFVCSLAPDGTATRTVENILGERILYKITYLDGEATLLAVFRATHGMNFTQIKSIDLRRETHRKGIEIARDLTVDMEADAARYCQGGQRQIAARYELTANHEFNRSNSRYRGR